MSKGHGRDNTASGEKQKGGRDKRAQGKVLSQGSLRRQGSMMGGSEKEFKERSHQKSQEGEAVASQIDHVNMNVTSDF